MCGIAGFQGDFPPDLLVRMAERLAHRGPDAAGSVVLPGVGTARSGLAHRRLSIIDLSEQGTQPMTVCCPACGSESLHDLALSYNGEIYNFRELRAELEACDHVFHSGTDSEVLLHLYGRHGPGFLERLNGIFALAIIDGRARGRPEGIERGDVILARDGLGVKPLYYAAPPEGVLFASETKALLAWGGLGRGLDADALFQSVAYLWTPAPATVLSAVRKVEPGQAVVLRAGEVRRTWYFYDVPHGQELLTDTGAEIAGRLRHLVHEAVRGQLVSDVPVAAFLSGGMDSSAVVASAVAAGQRIQCYCIGFRGDIAASEGMPDDVPYARKVARHLGVDLEVLEAGSEIIRELPRMLYLLDEPQADPAPINALLLCERARRDGFKVMLSGAGGDDVFSGYRRHEALAVDGMLGQLPLALRRILANGTRQSIDGWLPFGFHRAPVRRLAKLLMHIDLPAEQRLISAFWWSGEPLRRGLFAPDFLAQVSPTAASDPLVRSLERVRSEPSRLNRLLYLEMKHFLADHNLNYTDRAGMASGVEVRVPLLDVNVIDFAARIPPGLKQEGRTGKAILKKAFERDLPHDVVYRPKTGFGAPLRRWLRHELRDTMLDTLSPRSLRDRGIFDPGAVQRLIAADRAGRVDGAYTLFSLMCMELWCRMFVDQGSVPSLPGMMPSRNDPALYATSA